MSTCDRADNILQDMHETHYTASESRHVSDWCDGIQIPSPFLLPIGASSITWLFAQITRAQGRRRTRSKIAAVDSPAKSMGISHQREESAQAPLRRKYRNNEACGSYGEHSARQSAEDSCAQPLSRQRTAPGAVIYCRMPGPSCSRNVPALLSLSKQHPRRLKRRVICCLILALARCGGRTPGSGTGLPKAWLPGPVRFAE